MKFIGYFPGIKFQEDSQFGRQVHTRHFIRKVLNHEDIDSQFILGDSSHEDPQIKTIPSIPIKNNIFEALSELVRTLYLIIILMKARDECIVYNRDSPYFAPIICSLFPNVSVVTECNGMREDDKKKTKTEQLYESIRWKKTKRSKALIAVSESIATVLRKKGMENVNVVENGINTDIFNKTSNISTEPPFTFGYVGGLQFWQGVERMLSILDKIDHEFEFIIAGGTEKRQKELEKTVENHGLDQNINFTGRVEHEKIPDIINATDVCLGPFYKVRRASPMKVYEYLACARPVVVVNGEGLQYLSNFPGVNVLEYEKTDREIAKEMDQILETMKTNDQGSSLVRDEYSWEAQINKIISVCKEIND